MQRHILALYPYAIYSPKSESLLATHGHLDQSEALRKVHACAFTLRIDMALQLMCDLEPKRVCFFVLGPWTPFQPVA